MVKSLLVPVSSVHQKDAHRGMPGAGAVAVFASPQERIGFHWEPRAVFRLRRINAQAAMSGNTFCTPARRKTGRIVNSATATALHAHRKTAENQWVSSFPVDKIPAVSGNQGNVERRGRRVSSVPTETALLR
ncbi:hypothetical protein [Oleispirillum naphthae]|uniref:hypothetical protein n=1 Tax=Oleispirillum naphthae TaxID=2838853 RepID=UPI003082340B